MKKILISALCGSVVFSTQVFSQSKEDINLLKEQIQVLVDEIEKLKEQTVMPELYQKSFAGLGYAASKVYFSPQGLSIGGYGEIVYINYDSSDKKSYSDLYRFIPYIGYKFTDNIILNSEIEFEHGANTERGGEVTVEFAYLDFLINKWFNLRVGNVLIPLGLTNLQHEPIFFNSVLRPEIETKIIPTTWNENGVIIFSNTGNWDYHLGVVNGFHATKKGEIGFTADSWVRNGRQAGAKAISEDWAVVGRIDYTGIKGLYAGASFYRGNSGQGEKYSGKRIDGTVSLWDLHLRYQLEGIEITGVYVKGSLDDADLISLYNGEVIGKDVYGYYLNVSYDVIPFIKRESNFSLPVFIRYERYNLHDKVPEGFSKNPALDRTIWTLGINFKPHPNIVFKADYQFRDNKNNSEANRFEAGFGFIF